MLCKPITFYKQHPVDACQIIGSDEEDNNSLLSDLGDQTTLIIEDEDFFCPLITESHSQYAVHTVNVTKNNFLNSIPQSSVAENNPNLKMINDRKRTHSVEINNVNDVPTKHSVTESKILCDCCKLIRSGRNLPIARRGRPFYSSTNDRDRFMCGKCNQTLIQQQQQLKSSFSNSPKILTENSLSMDSTDSSTKNIFDEILGGDYASLLSTNDTAAIVDTNNLQQQPQQDITKLYDHIDTQKESTTTTERDLPTEIEFTLNETPKLDMNDYQPAQMLIWKLNASGDVDLSYDTSSSPLTDDEKKALVDEAVRKLNVALSSHKTPVGDSNVDAIELTYAALNKTMQTLSTSTL
ncbi:unnamed protein product [Didymodactylos carnosus]|uniref:Uncharacterized protein n=1 Tax=Didymodactylos carnosus TaxID=1234261 RepID=A0A814WRB1_9BILA|nr:unnamed protein product [Didymodactylos carnosus]CAF1201800.1 unnamed protein product [Didymodactylos carnosus]CAF3797832.1 unnamed protein product [Didymodactylos carnosus]CAF3966249.1 unnamed protein product [Didymodactylos carnosus]